MKSISRALASATLAGGLVVAGALGAAPAHAAPAVVATQQAPAVTTPTVVAPTAKAAIKTRIVQQPASASIRGTQKASFKVRAKGTALKYQWYVKAPGKTSFGKIKGATKPGYTTPKQANKTAKSSYRVVVSGHRGKVTSRTATLTVKAYKSTAITGQPANASIRGTSTATFRVKAAGEGLRYQWDVKAPGKSAFSAIKGATKSSYTTPKQANKTATSQYRVRVSGKAGSKTSRAATLKVTAWAKPALSSTKAVRAATNSSGKIEVRGRNFAGATITVKNELEGAATLKLVARTDTVLTFATTSKEYVGLESVTIKNPASSVQATVLLMSKASVAGHQADEVWATDLNDLDAYDDWPAEVWHEANYAIDAIANNTSRWALIDDTAVALLENAIDFQESDLGSALEQTSYLAVMDLYDDLWWFLNM